MEEISKEKVMAGKTFEEKILPPDPARLVEFALSGIAAIEHATPLPPVVERAHKEVAGFTENLPRPSAMGEFVKRNFMQFP